jgi:hypothetical protein
LTKIIDKDNNYYFINEMKSCPLHTSHLEFDKKCFKTAITVHVKHKTRMDWEGVMTICNLFGSAYPSITIPDEEYICRLGEVDIQYAQEDEKSKNRYKDVYVQKKGSNLLSPRLKLFKLPVEGDDHIGQFCQFYYYLK